MKHLFGIFGIAASIFLAACGGGGTKRSLVLNRPNRVSVSSQEVLFRGRLTKLACVSNESGSLSVIDTSDDEFVDTDDGDDFDETPITVGGRPVSIAIYDGGAGLRIFVADDEHQELHAFDIDPPADPESDVVDLAVVEWGPLVVGRASRPTFEDKGRASTPTLRVIDVDPSIAQTEAWTVEFKGESEGYEVTGSRSGEQTGRALEGDRYVTDDGSLTFEVDAGGESTSSGDVFRFGTVLARPFSLSARPVEIAVSDGKLLAVAADPASLFVIDPVTLEIVDSQLLSIAAGDEVIPSGIAVGGGRVLTANLASPDLREVDLASLAVNVISLSEIASGVGISPSGATAYALPAGRRAILPIELATEQVEAEILLAEIPQAFVAFEHGGSPFAVVPLATGNVDVVDLTSGKRLDSNIRGGDTQSDSFAEEFSDAGAESDPDLVAIDTHDGVTRSERWHFYYEGVVPGADGIEGVVTGDLFMGVGVDLEALGIVAGDKLILFPQVSAEEVNIISVSSNTILLASSPAAQGMVTADVRSGESYIALGALSGAQIGRLKEGTAYSSDGGEVALTIRASRSSPTTRGDYFTFITTDGIDPILTGEKGAGHVAVFARTGESDPSAYVTMQDTESVSVLDLLDLDERDTIR